MAKNLSAEKYQEPRHALLPARGRPEDFYDSLLKENKLGLHYSKDTIISKPRFIASGLQVAKLMRQDSKIIWSSTVPPWMITACQKKLNCSPPQCVEN